MHFGPFSLIRNVMPATAAAPACIGYQFLIQFSSRTSVQLMCLRFAGHDERRRDGELLEAVDAYDRAQSVETARIVAENRSAAAAAAKGRYPTIADVADALKDFRELNADLRIVIKSRKDGPYVVVNRIHTARVDGEDMVVLSALAPDIYLA